MGLVIISLGFNFWGSGVILDGFRVVLGGFGCNFGGFLGCILLFLGLHFGFRWDFFKVVGLMWLREVLAVFFNMGSWSALFLYLLEFHKA